VEEEEKEEGEVVEDIKAITLTMMNIERERWSLEIEIQWISLCLPETQGEVDQEVEAGTRDRFKVRIRVRIRVRVRDRVIVKFSVR
jgi:hypothetical protein